MNYSNTFLLVLFVSFVGSACIADSNPIEVRDHEDSEATEVDIGQTHEFETVDRDAVVLLFDGKLPDDADFDVELDRVFDADVYVGPDDEIGDPHWITRGRLLDGDGDPIWTQRVNSLYQLLQFLTVIVEQLIPLNITVDMIFDLAEEDYPELLQFAVKVPTELDGAESYVLEIHHDDQWHEVASYELDDLLDRAETPEPDIEYEIESIVDEGPPEDRINVVILGDGYTEDEREKFEGDVQAVAERFMDSSPMTEHADLFNIKSVWTPSEESGAGFDCNHAAADSDCEQDFRDTPFDTTFVIPALGEEYGFPTDDISDRVAMPLNLERIYEIASLTHYDEIIMISNSDKFSGFAGLYVAMVTNFDDRDYFPDTAVHEVGHTLGLLGDEYTNPSDACYYNEPMIPLPANIGLVEDHEVKWDEWIASGTPVPTPDEHADDFDVGAFEGAYNCDFLVRPAHQCKMNNSSHEFCSVCAEQMVRRFYSVVDPAPATQGARVESRTDGSVELSVPVRNEDRYQVEWVVDGEPLNRRSSTITLPAGELSDDWIEVEAYVRNSTAFLNTLDESVESSYRFDIRPVDES